MLSNLTWLKRTQTCTLSPKWIVQPFYYYEYWFKNFRIFKLLFEVISKRDVKKKLSNLKSFDKFEWLENLLSNERCSCCWSLKFCHGDWSHHACLKTKILLFDWFWKFRVLDHASFVRRSFKEFFYEFCISICFLTKEIK